MALQDTFWLEKDQMMDSGQKPSWTAKFIAKQCRRDLTRARGNNKQDARGLVGNQEKMHDVQEVGVPCYSWSS